MGQYKLTLIKAQAKRLRLSSLFANASDILIAAQKSTPSYDDFLCNVLEQEVQCRTEKQLVQRRKLAKMPLAHNLDNYDSSLSNGISHTQLNQLRELHWVDECYNIMLTGPCGVGKTLIASGLCNDAINRGYKAYFRCMEEILNTLKTKVLIPSAKQEYKRLREAHVIVIDDLMHISVSQEEGNLFFSFVNNTFESTSYIITTNKSPAEWAKALDDEVLATALLDRILFKCQLIQLSGTSYRLKNRQTIF